MSELAGSQPIDFVLNFRVLYPEDAEALDELFIKTPGFGGREFLMQALATIIRGDSTIRFDAEHGGYVRRTQAGGV